MLGRPPARRAVLSKQFRDAVRSGKYDTLTLGLLAGLPRPERINELLRDETVALTPTTITQLRQIAEALEFPIDEVLQ